MLLIAERRIRVHVYLSRRDLPADEQDGQATRRQLVLVHGFPPHSPVDLCARLVAEAVEHAEGVTGSREPMHHSCIYATRVTLWTQSPPRRPWNRDDGGVLPHVASSRNVQEVQVE